MPILHRLLGIASLSLFLLACGPAPQQREATPNHLIDSQSPYLLQHAYNPVDWYPWGEVALEKAQSTQRLMVISIGYAACHWCHVMEEESFEDSTVARVMNENFVSVKVDREERPDLDAVYMNAALITTGRTGWPLNAIALPDGRPVFAATYFPREDWLRVLENFQQMYQNNPQQLATMADQVSRGVQQLDYAELVDDAPAFEPALLDSACNYLLDQVDFEYGGLQGAPKFPLPVVQELLLNYGQLTQNERALEAVHLTLDRLWKGGIYDHLGGGFARYSVDSVWHVPHFEKMLYDNAMLSTLYSRAYRQRPDSQYRKVVYHTLAFVEREMQDSLGGFYSSLDADSEGQEGNYYTWTEKDITKTILQRADAFKSYYNVSPFGNWPERRRDKLNILHITEDAAAVAQRQGLTDEEFWAVIETSKRMLFTKRQDRERPALDDKVLTAWNGLMIQAYAEAYRSFGEEAFLAQARRAAAFVEAELYRPDGGLYRSWRNGEAYQPAFADDYAFLVQGYLSLYQATFEEQWLRKAEALMDFAVQNFFDEATGLFYLTSTDGEALISRPRELSDNVLPAANSALARDLFYLGHFLYRKDYLAKAEQMLRNVASNLPDGGVSTANWSILLSHYAHPFYETAIVGPQAQGRRATLDEHYLPNALLLGGEDEGEMQLLRNKAVVGQTLIYVCRDKVCKQPTESTEQALRQMQ